MSITKRPETEKAFRRITSLLRHTDDFVLTFVLYRDAKEQRENAAKLKNLIDLPVTEVALKGDNLNPVRTFLDLPKEPRQAIFYTFLGSSLPEGKSDFDKFAGYVNIQREAFEDAPHAVVLWLREEQLVRLMRRAPDFWAWRSGVFDVRGELEPGASTYRALEEADAFGMVELEEQTALYRDILEEQLKSPKPDLAYVVRTLLRLAAALEKTASYSEMLMEAQKALHLSEGFKTGTLAADAMALIGKAYRGMGRYADSLEFLKSHLELREGLGDKNGVSVASSLLAGLLKDMGRFEDAESLYHRALETSSKANHLEYGSQLNNFADLLERMERYAEAEKLYREALDLLGNSVGKSHPYYALGLNNLAGTLELTGRYDEAEKFYRESLKAGEQELSNFHTYAKPLNNLANLLLKTGRLDEADSLYQKALNVCQKYLGEEHPDTLVVAENYEHFLRELEQQKASTP